MCNLLRWLFVIRVVLGAGGHPYCAAEEESGEHQFNCSLQLISFQYVEINSHRFTLAATLSSFDFI